jgi:hypothetical protein
VQLAGGPSTVSDVLEQSKDLSTDVLGRIDTFAEAEETANAVPEGVEATLSVAVITESIPPEVGAAVSVRCATAPLGIACGV